MITGLRKRIMHKNRSERDLLKSIKRSSLFPLPCKRWFIDILLSYNVMAYEAQSAIKAITPIINTRLYFGIII